MPSSVTNDIFGWLLHVPLVHLDVEVQLLAYALPCGHPHPPELASNSLFSSIRGIDQKDSFGKHGKHH
jgi:hypothetical protein